MQTIEKAIESFKKKNWDDAINGFTSFLEQNPENAEAYNNLALCYANKGDLEKAEKNYLKCLELNPKIPQAYINLSDIYYRQRDFEHGIALLTNGIYELPDDIILSHYLARFYMEDARLDMAIDELEKVLEKQPDNYDAYYDLGKVHFELGNYELAAENFENVLEYKENNEFIYYYLAQSYEANDEIDKAISNYLKAITVNDKFPPAYKKAGILFMARGDFADAIEYFEDYINLDVPQEEKDNVKKLIEKINNNEK